MRFENHWAVGAALFLVGCSDAAGISGVVEDAGASRADARASPPDARADALSNPSDGGRTPAADAPSNPTDGAPPHTRDSGADSSPDARPDATSKDTGITPIPIDATTDFKPSPVPLSELVGTGSESRAELVSRLRDHVLSTAELFHPYSLDDTNWAQTAEDLITDGWQANQVPSIPIAPPIDWADGHGDENWHFQLNSLRPSIPFAYAAWQTGDTANLGRMLAVVDDWIDFNLVDDLPNGQKWYDMSTGLRAHYIAVTLAELLQYGPAPGTEEGFDRTVEKLVWALHAHGERLADPSFLPAGNHALFVVLGLATVCRVVPQFAECGEWPAYALEGVRRYVSDTVSSEHVTLEHSPEYHRFVALTLKQMDETALFDESLASAADGMLHNLLWMYHPNAEISLVGDSYGVARLGESAELDYVLSEGGAGTVPTLAPTGFFEAGFAILRDPWSRRPFSGHSYLFFSAAHHSAVHKQADDFTFEWSRRGVPIIIDSGKFEYNASPERRFFVSTRAANTIEVDGASHQVGGVAAFGSALTDVGKTASGVQYASAVATRRPSDVVHARVLAMHDDWLLVADRLTSGTEHTYRQWFGLHENFQLVGSTPVLTFNDSRGNEVRLLTLGDHEATESARGQNTPEILGWISHAYQSRVPRWSVASRVVASNTTMVALLATPAVTSASAVPIGDTLEVTIESAGAARRYTVAFGQSTGSVTE